MAVGDPIINKEIRITLTGYRWKSNYERRLGALLPIGVGDPIIKEGIRIRLTDGRWRSNYQEGG
jgi:hypothetical protein